MIIKYVEEKDIEQIVSIHIDAFDGFFLTDLGRHFLSVYYKSVLRHSDGVLLGCFENGDLIGFCAATKLSQGFNSKLVKSNLMTYLFEGLHILLTNPRAIIRLLKNFSKTNDSHNDKGLYSELLSIAVSRKAQGLGVGRELLKELEAVLKQAGYYELSLTTDYYSNEKAISFYQNNGYSIMYDFITYPSRRMYRMIKNIK